MSNIVLDEVEKVILDNKMSNFNEIDYYKDKRRFLIMYLEYRKLFTEYIIEKLELKKYDCKIKKSIYKFLKIENINMDFYQQFCSKNLEYIYIRNNIYIENLNIDESNFLEQRIKIGKINMDRELYNFIEKTYKKVIFADLLNNGEVCMTFYGPKTSEFCASNDALIIGLRYDEFKMNGMNDDEWNMNHDNQIQFLYQIFQEMENEFSKKIDIPVVMIKYNEFSTTKTR